MVAFTLLIEPLPEEVGSHGYLLDQTQAHWPALAAGFVVGFPI
jgi:hypothetical protein